MAFYSPLAFSMHAPQPSAPPPSMRAAADLLARASRPWRASCSTPPAQPMPTPPMTSTFSSRPAPEYYPTAAYHAPAQQQRPTLPPIAHLERLAQLPPRTSHADDARVRPLSDRPHADAVTPPDDAGLPAYAYPPSTSTPPAHVYADVHPESQMSVYAPPLPQNDEFFAPPVQEYTHDAHSAPPQLQKPHEELQHHQHHQEQPEEEEEELSLEMDIPLPDPPPAVAVVPAPAPVDESYVVDWLDFTRKRSAHFIAEKTCEMICYLWFAGPPSTSTSGAMETPPPTPPTAHATPATGGEGLFSSPQSAPHRVRRARRRRCSSVRRRPSSRSCRSCSRRRRCRRASLC